MARRRTWRRVLLAGMAVLAAIAGWRGVAGSLGPRVAVVDVRGVITDATEVLGALERVEHDPQAVAVVVRIDSPGGAVAPSQELYEAVVRLTDAKPVVASLGNVAASGGYYVAAATDHIVASPGTITGSLGAIMQVRHLRGLAEKLGVDETAVTSGPFKDIGSSMRALRPDDHAILQGLVDDVLRQFVDAVAAGRGLPVARVRALADGRVYSGAQARDAGLVDELGGLSVAIARAWTRGGGTGSPVVRWERPRQRPWWWRAFTSAETPLAATLGGGLFFLYGDAATR